MLDTQTVDTLEVIYDIKYGEIPAVYEGDPIEA
jgi:hypothetical protein